jgi:hypothetical protein
VELCERHTGLTCRNQLIGIDKGTHRVLVEIRRGPRVLSGLVPVTEVVDKQLNAEEAYRPARTTTEQQVDSITRLGIRS